MSQPRQTHTFVELDLSPEAFEEIRRKLADAGYYHSFKDGLGSEPLRLDMQGIALKSEEWRKDPDKYYHNQKCAPHGKTNCPACTHPRGD
jgi:hypothetical protein